jgi:8-oxo-dGTP pyrophosphatase MutT (NUDIX family)
MTTSKWQTKSSKVVYENPWMFVREDTIIHPSGKDGLYGVVESKSEGVFVVPLDQDNNTYIVRQEHYTTREMAWQCVAGRTDGEAAEVAAKRELLEEAGLRAGSIHTLAKARTASGLTTFKTTVCIARDLTTDTSQFDEDEISEIRKVSLETVKDMIFSGEISATESIAAFLLAIAYLEKEKAI